MAVTMEQVLTELNKEEPNYARAVKLGEEAMPHLKKLVRDGEPLIASKATYLASLIQSEEAADVVEMAANSESEQVRVAAAASVRNLATLTAPLVNELLGSADVGVRKVALLSIKQQTDSVADVAFMADVTPAVEQIAENDENDYLRRLAREILGG